MGKQLRVAAALTIIGLMLAACGAQNPAKPAAPAAIDPRASAEQAQARGAWPEAAQYWEAVVQAAPNDQAAALSLIQALRRSGACVRAAPYLEKLQAAAPRDPVVFLEAGKCLLIAGRFAAAQSAFETAAKIDPNAWEAASMTGIALDYQDRSADARVYHDRAVALSPGNPGALANKGLSLALGGHLDQALAVTREAAARPGAGARARANLAFLEAIAGNGAAALAGRDQDDPETARLLERIAAAAGK